MFERWKKDSKTEKLNPQDIDNMKNNRAKAGFVAAVGALGVTIANQPDVVDLHHAGPATQQREMTAAEMYKMQEQGPNGATVYANPETGQAIVTMHPPGDEQPVQVDLRQPTYDVSFNKDGSIASVEKEGPK